MIRLSKKVATFHFNWITCVIRGSCSYSQQWDLHPVRSTRSICPDGDPALGVVRYAGPGLSIPYCEYSKHEIKQHNETLHYKSNCGNMGYLIYSEMYRYSNDFHWLVFRLMRELVCIRYVNIILCHMVPKDKNQLWWNTWNSFRGHSSLPTVSSVPECPELLLLCAVRLCVPAGLSLYLLRPAWD